MFWDEEGSEKPNTFVKGRPAPEPVLGIYNHRVREDIWRWIKHDKKMSAS